MPYIMARHPEMQNGTPPTSTLAAGKGQEAMMMNVGFHGIWGLLVLAADVWAIRGGVPASEVDLGYKVDV